MNARGSSIQNHHHPHRSIVNTSHILRNYRPGWIPKTQINNHRRHHTSHIQCASSSPRREMSLQQRWRALKFNIKDKCEHLTTVPPLSTIIAAIAAFHRLMQPIYNAINALNAWWLELQTEYNQFIAEETKRKWTWSNRNKKELEFLASIPIYLFYVFCTLMYEAFMPVSFLGAIVLPLYYAWAVWDRWWLSPVFLGMVVMLPLKFLPMWGFPYFCWVWPGLV